MSSAQIHPLAYLICLVDAGSVYKLTQKVHRGVKLLYGLMKFRDWKFTNWKIEIKIQIAR